MHTNTFSEVGREKDNEKIIIKEKYWSRLDSKHCASGCWIKTTRSPLVVYYTSNLPTYSLPVLILKLHGPCTILASDTDLSTFTMGRAHNSRLIIY